MTDELFTQGTYWYTKGIHWTAFGCLVVGSFVFWLGRYLQTGGAIPSFLVAAFIYLLATQNLRGKEPSREKGV